MAGPNDTGGIGITLPAGDGAAAYRDLRHLIRAIWLGDEAHQEAILASTNTKHVAHVAAATLAAYLVAEVQARRGRDPDAPPAPLTRDELLAGDDILDIAITGPGEYPEGR